MNTGWEHFPWSVVENMDLKDVQNWKKNEKFRMQDVYAHDDVATSAFRER